MTRFTKVVLWLGATALLFVLVIAGSLYLMTRRAERRAEQAQRDARASKKLRIGDTPQTVRLRAGVPDSIGRPRERKEIVWLYGSGDRQQAVIFDSLRQVDRVFALGEYFWPPEDGLAPTEYSPVDATIQSFRERLGVPCDTLSAEDSTWVRFYYTLSPEELAEDSVYRQQTSQRPAVLRTLQVDLRKGRSVMYHGWTKAKKTCSGGSQTK
jgi:plasmid stabilization system protein ParE